MSEAVDRVREFARMAQGVLVIKALVPRGGPQKLDMTDLEALLADRDEWKRKASDAAATLGHNRVATNAAGDQVAKLRRLLTSAALFGNLPKNLMAEIADAIPGYDKAEAPHG